MSDGLKELDLTFNNIKGAATPRRMVVCVEGLVERQPDKTEEILGPPKKAAFDANNQPTKAAEGFAKSKGAGLEDIQIVTTPKGEYLMVLREQKGKETKEILAGLLLDMVKSIPFPKSMRWGEYRTTFARPIQWLLALYNGQPIIFSLEGAGETGVETYGHRFMAPDALTITDYDQYVNTLRDNFVIVDIEERRQAVINEINRAAQEAGGQILPDDELVDTVANLVEYPHAVCGSFDPKFLELPQDALITSMREHQKYFAVVDASGRLKPNFIAVNNTRVQDLTLAAEGHQRVLRARLEDGLFFFKEDQNRSLVDRVKDLNGIIFQAKLGTMQEKSERIQSLSGWLAKTLAPEMEERVSRAALLAKADLLTAMVNEFPSLQGLMGRDYARLNGEDDEVATAIEEHYMPIRAGSPGPSGVTGAIVSMADRMDTIAGCFGIGQIPSGTADPFGLRRQALGLIHIIEDQGFSISLSSLIDESLRLYGGKLSEETATAKSNTLEFIKGRYRNNKITRGVTAETVEAVISVFFDDLADCGFRIKALATISEQESFSLLAGAFKRVMNIIKDYHLTDVDPALLEAPEEKKLYKTYQAVAREAQPFIDQRQYDQALSIILKMKEPVDLFFDKVMVMTDNIALRENRLKILTSIAALFLQVGDFSKMYAMGG